MKDKTTEVKEIMHNATVVYSAGVKEQFEAIRLIDKEIFLKLISTNKTETENYIY